MQVIHDSSWQRRGFSIVWDPSILATLVAHPNEVTSYREFARISKKWPDTLPSMSGNTLIVSGLDGCLDVLNPDDAEKWLERELKDKILSFQSEYEGLAALIFWVPGGRKRVTVEAATESYLWRCSAPYQQRELQIGRILWGGSEGEAKRIINPAEKNQDSDGPGWVGVHHPRIT